MEEEIVSEIENYKVDEEELDNELGKYDIDLFLVNEFEKIEELYQNLEFKYHGLKAKREALYGT